MKVLRESADEPIELREHRSTKIEVTLRGGQEIARDLVAPSPLVASSSACCKENDSIEKLEAARRRRAIKMAFRETRQQAKGR